MSNRLAVAFGLFFSVGMLNAQVAEPSGKLADVLKRLDALEEENRKMADELRALRQALAANEQPAAAAEPRATQDERIGVLEKRSEEQAQTKVEASQKFPLSIYGMVLFNAFNSSRGEDYASYGLLNGPARGGATVGQSILGLRFQGPSLPGDGRVSGSLTMDFWGGYGANPTESWFRIREAEVALNWKKRNIVVGRMKPLISPYAPSSLAEVAVPPLSGAGNLWFWLPQARYEERLALRSQDGFTLQGAVLQTDEARAYVPAQYAASLAPSRPAFEGRAGFWHKIDDARKIEIGGAFHASTSHVAGFSVPSRIASVDWSVDPLPKLHWTGVYYSGQNVAPLGSLGYGFNVYRSSVAPIQTHAGWTQFSVPVAPRLTLNLFGGIEGDHGSRYITRNLSYASNLMYRFGPNVVAGVEALQSRLNFYGANHLLVNHYDLALAYVF